MTGKIGGEFEFHTKKFIITPHLFRFIDDWSF
jgi:hypothetical protein